MKLPERHYLYGKGMSPDVPSRKINRHKLIIMQNRLSRITILSFIPMILAFSGCSSKGPKTKDNIAYQYYENGRVKVEAQVKDDTILNGIYKTYTPDGYLDNVYNYVDGKREGPAVTYYNNGQLRTKLNFVNNKLEGTATMYYKTGELYRVTHYKDGKAEGMRTSYYKNGKVMSEVPYKDDFPGLGIKEYTMSGKPVKNLLPAIKIRANQPVGDGKHLYPEDLPVTKRALHHFLHRRSR